MGFNASEEFVPVIRALRDNVGNTDAREVVYRRLVECLNRLDFDVWDELTGLDRILDGVLLDLDEVDEEWYNEHGSEYHELDPPKNLCPICGKEAIRQERTPGGRCWCLLGHSWKSKGLPSV